MRGAVSGSRRNVADEPTRIPAAFCTFLLTSTKCSPVFWGKSEVRKITPFTSPLILNKPALPQVFLTLNGTRTITHPRFPRRYSSVATNVFDVFGVIAGNQ